ncbi:MAG: signal peptide protein [Verrucomicrobiales bacterium]|nr:signal peptide protein [Verrucomicrobiales bacterium]
MKSAARITLVVFPWLLLVLIGVYLTYGKGIKDVAGGVRYRRTQEFFRTTGSLTKVEIKLPAAPPGQQASTLERPSITLTGKDLEAFQKLWSRQQPVYGGGGMCHQPAYEFRFFQASEMTARTTVCWSCWNFILPGGWPFSGGRHGFNADLPAARELLAFCDQRLPYHRSPANPLLDQKPDPASAESPAPALVK